MKTSKLVSGALAALALTGVTAALLSAAPDVPDKALRQELRVPIPPRAIVAAHSEEWNDVYFDKLTRPQPILHTEDALKEKWRGGLAEQQAQNAVPVPRRAGVKAHSPEWTDYYLDRYANSQIPLQASEHVNANSWQGGLAQGIEAIYK